VRERNLERERILRLGGGWGTPLGTDLGPPDLRRRAMPWKRGESITVSRDTAFSDGGELIHIHNADLPISSRKGSARRVIADPGGDGFICLGVSTPRGQRVGVLVVLRITRTGEVRSDLTILPPGGNVREVNTATIDIEGAVVAAGMNHDGSYYLIRMFPDDGTIDARYCAHFADWQETVRRHGQRLSVRYLDPLPDGKMLLAGSVSRSEGLRTSGPFVVRLNADGTVDQSFRKYGGPPNDGLTLEWNFLTVGHLPDGTIVAAGWIGEPDADLQMGTVVFLEDDGTPFPTMAEEWLPLLSTTNSMVPDRLTGGLVLGGFRHDGPMAGHACAVRMRTDGKPDYTASGGGLWKSGTLSTLWFTETTTSGAIIGLGLDLDVISLFGANPDGTPVAGLGAAGRAGLNDEKGVRPAGLCVSGDQAVVGLKTNGEGFALRSYRIDHVRASAPAPHVSQDAAERQAAVERATKSIEAQIAGNKWIADSNANMATSARMMGLAMKGLSRW